MSERDSHLNCRVIRPAISIQHFAAAAVEAVKSEATATTLSRCAERARATQNQNAHRLDSE